MRRNCHLAFILCFVWAAPRGFAEDGIPVESELVRYACGACHEPDDNNVMTRISFLRKSPEGWQLSVKRMIRMERVSLTADEAREVVRYLSDFHSLAPGEARLTFYEAEKRPTIETAPTKPFKDTCVRCHQGARVLAQRRAAEEWKLLKGMHLGYFPVVEFQSFREPRRGSEEEEEAGAARVAATAATTADQPEPDDRRERVDRVLDFLGKQYGLDTPEWRAFKARRQVDGDFSGRWLFVSYEPGKGPIVGEYRLTRSGKDYESRAELRLADGSTEIRQGKAVVYAGFDWRGSSQGSRLGDRKEVMMLSDDGSTFTGRFYRGAFGELGLDVTLSRLGSDPRIAGVSPPAVWAKSGAQTVRILGANLPSGLSPDEVRFGPGVQVKSVKAAGTANVLECEVEVDAAAVSGRRDIGLRSVTAAGKFAVYDRVDYVKVNPGEGMARLGGNVYPKQLVQFEAVAFNRGPDDQPLTADDIDLGPVAAQWGLEEYHIRNDDDDLKYVGTIDQSGLFTPSVEGPNPQRKGTNNFGDVWAVATYSGQGGETLRGRSHLLVTVPLYAVWDQPEATIP
jgi:quinohemoprotein amine dehydrogenase